MSGWSCVHDDNGTCTRVASRSCDPGMKGCIIAGRFRFTNPAKNRANPPANEAKVDTVEGGGGGPTRSGELNTIPPACGIPIDGCLGDGVYCELW
jgi:hypothetical protein